jgi:Uma2 family endonuclease
LAYDRGLKARLYARYGVPEYWVIDVKRRRTFVHTGPRKDGSWESVKVVEPSEPLTHAAVPRFRLLLTDI